MSDFLQYTNFLIRYLIHEIRGIELYYERYSHASISEAVKSLGVDDEMAALI
ncbi:hypothetical protein GOY13_01965 [Wolbachia endosymbiont of Cruorifilaria tuberocauda]|uniref:hypothetical protein n=1 Tax=Wolbachia endosymbiont of Cruorifilaria tuberocauda TaxID=1812111 RepID=UPI00158980AD|nr:hypothetical protein [Wolbachia endosymbiont of Cruorifilaria tuberocauda]QKX01697.1 hypothetical protein GOY13_01965 [Wolbachia endosymbiont of Cruorifilaria tuberocauda]